MYLRLFFLVALLQLCKTQNKCVREIQALKNDLQTEIRDTVRNTIAANNRSVTKEEILEMVEDKATKEDVQSIRRKVNSRTQLVIDTLASNQNMMSNKATKDDVRQSANELLQALNMTKDEIQAVIKAETESIVRSVLQDEIESLQNNTALLFQAQIQAMQTELQSVRNEILSLTGHIADIQNSTAQLLALSQITEQSTESPTTVQTTEQSMSTTAAPLYTCNGTPGWRQVVFINMTDTKYSCPPGLKLNSYSKRTCGRAHTHGGDCSSTTFSVRDFEYSRVCGRIRGYQVGATSAFYGYIDFSQTIDGYYVDGVSLTHGLTGRRQHIWSFAAGTSERGGGYVAEFCPCATSYARVVSPPFVGNDYFCESGLNSPWFNQVGIPFLDDPLWDGQNCPSTSTCCQLNNPPWFTKTLPNPTTDDIELRLCLTSSAGIDDALLELIELYIQ